MDLKKASTALFAAGLLCIASASAQDIRPVPKIQPKIKVPVPNDALTEAVTAKPEGRVTIRAPYINSKLYLEATGDMVRNRIIGLGTLTAEPHRSETASILPVTHDLDEQSIVLQANLEAGNSYRFQIELFSANLEFDRRLANFVEPKVSVVLRSDNRNVLRSLEVPLKQVTGKSGASRSYQTGAEIIDFTVRAAVSKTHALVIEVPMRPLTHSDEGQLSNALGNERVVARSSVALSSIYVEEN